MIASLIRGGLAVAIVVLLGACEPQKQARSPAEMRAQLLRLLPANTRDRQGWATDIQLAFTTLKIDPSDSNLCATLAVTEQESTFNADPVVPGLAKIARAEIERRAARLKLPKFLVRVALQFESPNGKTYDQRLAVVRTEKELSQIYEDLIGSVPMGRRLFQGANPVHTGGPMQVSIAFAEHHARAHPYPYTLAKDESIRHEVFSRRGGMYFGIAHLLGYPATYPKALYRFADYNAGFYASRNAAFQKAVSLASGVPIALDGDLIRYKARKQGEPVGSTEAAVESLSEPLEMTDAQIRHDLAKGDSAKFEKTMLYARAFELAERLERRPLPRAVLPRIKLESPKITRELTTEWFATRVDGRYKKCMAKASR